jgi:hypothetical protein
VLGLCHSVFEWFRGVDKEEKDPQMGLLVCLYSSSKPKLGALLGKPVPFRVDVESILIRSKRFISKSLSRSTGYEAVRTVGGSNGAQTQSHA